MEVKLEDLTLDNLANGKALEQFQERLEQVAFWFSTPGLYKETGGGITAKLNVEVSFHVNPETNAITVETRCAATEPKRKTAIGFVHANRGKFFNMVEPEQGPLFQDASASTRGE